MDYTQPSVWHEAEEMYHISTDMSIEHRKIQNNQEWGVDNKEKIAILKWSTEQQGDFFLNK